MTDTALNLRSSISAPPPLDPFEREIITPENAELEARQRRAIPLSKKQFSDLVKRIGAVEQELIRRGYPELKRDADEIRGAAMETFRKHRADELFTLHNLAALLTELKDKDDQAEDVKLLKQFAARMMKLKPLQALLEDRKRLIRQYEDHHLAMKRDQMERTLEAGLIKEASIFERLIIEAWRQLQFYQVLEDRRGRRSLLLPKFRQVVSTPDSHAFLIETAFQSGFGTWRSSLPEGVHVLEHLAGESTLDQLSAYCQRQVVARYDRRDASHGVWIVVHRLLAADGLMNYITFDDVIQYYPHEIKDYAPVCIGVGENRKVEWLNFEQFPHWLIGGYTGSGKSNMVNCMIGTLISQQSPESIRLVMCDLKGGLEFGAYDGIPHLLGDIAETVPAVATTLEGLSEEMNRRFSKFKRIARSYLDYRRARPDEYMPRIVVFFDEVASIMEQADTNRILHAMREIARMGRAVGIHMVLCTQRPDVKAIEGSIKINLMVRMSGPMPTSADSVTILGNSAARDIAAIPGRMIYQLSSEPKMIQTPHMPTSSIKICIDQAKTFPPPPELILHADSKRVREEWTVEKVAEVSIKHLDGNIGYQNLFNACEGLTRKQAQLLVEQIMAMETIEVAGARYRPVRGKGKIKRLERVEDESPFDSPLDIAV